MRIRTIEIAAFGFIALAAGFSLSMIPACASDTDPTFSKFEGSSPDAKNYCAIATACGLVTDFGFGECINEIVRDQIELAPFGGDLGAQARYDCVKAAGTDCAQAKLCFGKVSGKDPRCQDADAGTPFVNQPRAFCDGDRITVCSEMTNDSQTFNCADDFIAQKFGGPHCIVNGIDPSTMMPPAVGSALCGFAACTGDVNAQCSGETLSYCTNGVEQHQNCILQGGSCDATSGKCQNTCQKSGYACLGSELDATCMDGSKLAQYDCSARPGWTCQVPQDSTTFGCKPPASECAWGTFQAVCVDGVKVQFCDDGTLKLYDCRDVGATACVPTKGGVACKL